MLRPVMDVVRFKAGQNLPLIDDHLSVAEVGVTLVEAEPVPEPDFDLSGMDLDPPGVDIVEHKPVAAPEYDLSSMSLEENSG